MSFSNQGQTVLQRMKFENTMQKQIEEVTNVFNIGNLIEIMYAVDNLEDLIEGIPEPQGLNEFHNRINELNKSFEVKKKVMQEQYDEKMKVAGCPDVVKKPPNIPDLMYFREKKRALFKLLSINDMMVQSNKIQHL